MRHVMILALMGLSAMNAGCVGTRFNNLFNRDPLAGSGGSGPVPNLPAKEALVEYLNANSERIKGILVDDLSITAKQGLIAGNLDGKMLAVKPRNFMLHADLFSKPMIMVGSNSEEFWFWNSKDREPHQYYCSYKDFEEGRFPPQLPMSFQPEWLMEVMGMGNYGPAEKLTMEHDNRTIRLIERTRTPHGKPIRKVVVLNRREVQVPHPQVIGFLLIDEKTNKEIVTVQVTKTQLVAIDSSRGAILPREMEIRMHEENARLSLSFNSLKINPEVPDSTFVRSPLPGAPPLNLARGAIQQAGSR